MNQHEALNLAVEMLERVAPGLNCDTREFYEKLHDIKSAMLPAKSDTVDSTITGTGVSQASVAEPNPVPGRWPRTAIVCGEEFCEIGQQTISGRDLLLMESCRDRGEAPAVIVDANTREVVMDEVYDGFQSYHEEVLAR